MAANESDISLFPSAAATGSISEGLAAISNEPANRPVVVNFMRFAAAIAVVPVLTYFIVSTVTKKMLPSMQSGLLSPPILGGIAAVLSLNFVMMAFAVIAVKEEPPRGPSLLDIASDDEVMAESEVVDELDDDQILLGKKRQ